MEKVRKENTLTRVYPIVFFIAVCLFIHYPLLSRPFTHSWVGWGDGLLVLWNFWWVKYATISLHQWIYFTQYFFYPVGVSLLFHDLTLFYGLLSVPLQSFLSLSAIYSIFIEGVIFSALLGMYYLCREISGHERASLVASLIYGFSPYLYSYTGQLSILSIQWLPWVLFCYFRWLKTKETRFALYCGLLAGCSFYSAVTHALFVLSVLCYFFVFYLVTRAKRSDLKKSFQAALPFSLVFLILTGPVLCLMFHEIMTYGAFVGRSLLEAEFNSIDLCGFVFNRTDHPISGRFFQFMSQNFNQKTKLHMAYLGFIPLIVSIGVFFSSATRKLSIPWVLLFCLSLFFVLGPTLSCAGFRPFGSVEAERGLHLPYYYLMKLPVFNALRVPKRLLVIVVCAFSVLVALALRGIFTKVEAVQSKRHEMVNASLMMLFIVFFLLDLWPKIGPDKICPIPLSVQWEASQGRKGALLFLPTAKMMSIAGRHQRTRQIMYFQSEHERPLITGYVSRRPSDRQLGFPETELMKCMEELADGRLLSEERVGTVKKSIEADLAILNIQSILLEKGFQSHWKTRNMFKTLHSLFPEYLVRNNDYYAIWHIPDKMREPSELVIDFSEMTNVSPLAPPEQMIFFYAEFPVAFDMNGISLLLPSTWSGKCHIFCEHDSLSEDFSVHPSFNHRDTELSVMQHENSFVIEMNGIPDDCFKKVTIKTPLKKTNQTIFHTAGPLFLRICSAGMDGGNGVHFTINGKKTFLRKRGYNLVALSQKGPSDIVSFDTSGDDDASRKLAHWIDALPEETLVIGGVCDDAASKLRENAVDALTQLGCSVDLRQKFRWSHAFIGKKGSKKGDAIECCSEGASVVSNEGILIPYRRIILSKDNHI